jgi:hypothetical protein
LNMPKSARRKTKKNAGECWIVVRGNPFAVPFTVVGPFGSSHDAYDAGHSMDSGTDFFVAQVLPEETITERIRRTA